MSIYTSVCIRVCVRWATLREHTQPVCVCVCVLGGGTDGKIKNTSETVKLLFIEQQINQRNKWIKRSVDRVM